MATARTIGAKELRNRLPQVIEAVRKGARFTVLYRSRAAFEIVPVGRMQEPALPLGRDPLYRARPVGRSQDGKSARNHDADLYPRTRLRK